MVQRVLIVMIILHGFWISNVFAATVTEERAWMKFTPPIKGMATNAKHRGEIVIQKLSYGVTQAGEWDEGDRVTGKVTSFADLTVLKPVDFTSPVLAQASAMKKQFDKVELVIAGTSKAFPYLKVTLEKVIIRSASVDISPYDPSPSETITLSYLRAVWEVGTSRAGYALDLQQKR